MDPRMFAQISRVVSSHATMVEGGKYVGFSKEMFLWTGLLVCKGKDWLLLRQEGGAFLYLEKGEDYGTSKTFVTPAGRVFPVPALGVVEQPRVKLLKGVSSMLEAFQLTRDDLDSDSMASTAYFEKCPHGWRHKLYPVRRGGVPFVITADTNRYTLPNYRRQDNVRVLQVLSVLRQAKALCTKCSPPSIS